MIIIIDQPNTLTYEFMFVITKNEIINFKSICLLNLQSHIDDRSSEHDDELKDSTSSDEGVNLSMRQTDLQRSRSHSDEENLTVHNSITPQDQHPNGHFNNPIDMDYPRSSTAARVTPDTQHTTLVDTHKQSQTYHI